MRPAEELLNLPVRMHGIELGRPVDLIVDAREPRALGFDVRCGDDAHRFLPYAVAAVTDDAIEIETPFVLLDFAQVSFYREHATSLRELNGSGGLLIAADGRLAQAVTAGRR